MSAQETEEESRPSREIAYRLFATEFDDASFSYSESDEERAPNYVVTPTGARVNRLFAVGVLTEVEYVNDDVLRGRIVDPTGAFVSYAGQYQPEEMAFLDRASPPAFVALSGKARTFQPEDSDRVFTSVRPESVSRVDAETRDRWTISAAEATLERVGVMAAALESGLEGAALRDALTAAGVDASLAAGVPLALDHYGTTPGYLESMRRVAIDALEVVAGDRESVRSLDREPSDAGDGVVLADLAADLDLAAVEPTESTDDEAATEPHATTAGSEDGGGDGSATMPAVESEAGVEAETGVDTETDADSETAPDPTATATETSAAAEDAAVGEGSEPADAVAAESEPEPTPSTASSPAASDADELGSFDDGSEPAAESPDEPATEPATDESAAETATGKPATEKPVTDESAAEPATEEPATDELGDFDAGDTESGETATEEGVEPAGTGDDDMYELDEEERRAVEEEFGTEFSTGSEVAPAGEADIDVPSVDEVEAAAESEPTTAPSTDDAAGATDASASSADESDPGADGDTETDAEVDLESVAVDAMAALDDGDGASREAVIAHVVEEYGVDPEAVEDAISSALMSGQCYEPAEDSLKAI